MTELFFVQERPPNKQKRLPPGLILTPPHLQRGFRFANFRSALARWGARASGRSSEWFFSGTAPFSFVFAGRHARPQRLAPSGICTRSKDRARENPVTRSLFASPSEARRAARQTKPNKRQTAQTIKHVHYINK